MRKKLAPKKKLPFYGKVAGGNARSRPDQAGLRIKGPKVAAKAYAEPLDPNMPSAPIGGVEQQNFAKDEKKVPRPPGLKSGGKVDGKKPLSGYAQTFKETGRYGGRPKE